MRKGEREKVRTKKHCSQSGGTRHATVHVQEDLDQAAQDAINAVMSDTRVSKDETRERLEDLREHVQTCIEAL